MVYEHRRVSGSSGGLAVVLDAIDDPATSVSITGAPVA